VDKTKQLWYNAPRQLAWHKGVVAAAALNGIHDNSVWVSLFGYPVFDKTIHLAYLTDG